MEIPGHSNVAPIIRHLTEIIIDISTGELLVPNFQRPYVWKASDIISLFDSIYKGYPIGSLLFWETSEELQTFKKIGPFPINKSKRSEINYIIDGHQRLSTLYGVLNPKSTLSDDDIAGWNLFFDLEKEEFIFLTGKEKMSSLIAMDKIIDTLDFLDECKRIQSLNPTNANVLINKAQKIAQAIITYKLTITQIKRGNINSAVEIFSRLNTKGLDMTPDQMLSALTYIDGDNGFKLADRIDQILEKLIEYSFSEIERIFIFRAIIAASKRDIYNVKLEDLAGDKKIKISTIVDRCEISILQAAKFLYENLNVPGDKLLPYNLQFVFLSEFFFVQPNPTIEQLEELDKWFWFTSYTGWFAGANTSKVKRGLDDIRDFAKGKKNGLNYIDYDTETADFPDKFDFRYARVKAFVLFLLSLEPLPLNDEHEVTEPKKLLSEIGSKALHFILANEHNSFANRMIIGPVRYGYAKHVLLDNSVLVPIDVLNSHGITEEAYREFKSHNFRKFLKLREKELFRLESEFVTTKGLNYAMPYIPQVENEGQLNLFKVFG
jgi:hypothetical protein